MTLSNNFQRLYCDSEIVWKKLVKKNIINFNTTVYTRSISLKKKNIKSAYLDKRVLPKKREKFKNSIFLIEKKLNKIFAENKKFEKYSIIFLQVFNTFQSNILDALILEHDFNFSGKTLISIPETDNKFLNTFLFPSFYNLLKDKNNVEIIRVEINFDNHRPSTGDTKARLLQKIYIGGFSSILWWVASRGFLPSFFFKNNTIGIIGQSELLKSTVSTYIKAGFKTIFFKPRINEQTTSQKVNKLCSEMIRLSDKVLVKRFSLIKCELLRKKSQLLFKNKLIDEIKKYFELYEWWDKELLNHKNMKFIFSGYLKGAFSMALSHAAKKHKIKIVSFQHGVTREIVETKGERSIFYETTFCDYFFTFNKKSSFITEKFKHSSSRAKILEAGPLQEFQNLKRTDLKLKEILYVSTNLYTGNYPNTIPLCDDNTLALWEIKIVKKILEN